MQISTGSDAGSVATLTPPARLVGPAVGRLRSTIDDLLEDGRLLGLVLDLERLASIDDAGIELLVALRWRCLDVGCLVALKLAPDGPLGSLTRDRAHFLPGLLGDVDGDVLGAIRRAEQEAPGPPLIGASWPPTTREGG